MLSRLSRCGSLYWSKLPVARLSHSSAESSQLQYRHLIKPLAFTITVCGTSFVAASVWQYENRRNDYKFSLFGNNSSKNSRGKFQSDDLFTKMKLWWNSQNEGFKVFLGIASLNGLVFLGWRIPRLQATMARYFITSIESKSIRCLPMILSNFSHFSPLHLGLNMMVLYSFSNIGVHLFGKEHFLALYLSSGVMSTFTSYVYKVAVCSMAPSLGASGAIIGILAATCIERPDIKLMIIFLPFFSFSSATALKGLILMDSLGLIFKWSFFDHAAHLGGTLIGASYAYELKRILRDKQLIVVNYWKKLKQLF